MYLKTIKLCIEGKVQGVGYRYFTRNEANLLGVKGWVRNLPGGAVEAVLQGTAHQLDLLMQILNDGPTFGNVARILNKELKTKKIFNNFNIKL